MPRTGGGNYVLPAGNPVAPGTTITSTWGNTTMNDLAAALTQSIARDGQTAPTANLPMAGFKHTSVGAATDELQYLRADQAQTNSLAVLGAAAMPSANTYTATLALAIATFTVGQVVYLLPPDTNTGAATLNVNGTGAVAVSYANGFALAAGALTVGIITPLWWAGADWRIVSPAIGDVIAARPAGAGAVFFGGPDQYLYFDGSKWNLISNTGGKPTVMNGKLAINSDPPTLPAAPLDVRVNAFRRICLLDYDPLASSVGASAIGTLNNAGNAWGNLGVIADTAFYPVVDNAWSLGVTGARWTEVYSATGTINTSDARLKTDIAPCTLGLDFVESLNPVSFKFIVGSNVLTREPDGQELVPGYIGIDGVPVPPTRRIKYKDVVTPVPGVRPHWGLIAQEVQDAVIAAGLPDFGGYVRAVKEDVESEQSLRYDEFIAPLVKAIQELSAKVKNLEAQLAAQP